MPSQGLAGYCRSVLARQSSCSSNVLSAPELSEAVAELRRRVGSAAAGGGREEEHVVRCYSCRFRMLRPCCHFCSPGAPLLLAALSVAAVRALQWRSLMPAAYRRAGLHEAIIRRESRYFIHFICCAVVRSFPIGGGRGLVKRWARAFPFSFLFRSSRGELRPFFWLLSAEIREAAWRDVAGGRALRDCVACAAKRKLRRV